MEGILTSDVSHGKTFQQVKVVIQSHSNKLRYLHKVTPISKSSHRKTL